MNKKILKFTILFILLLILLFIFFDNLNLNSRQDPLPTSPPQDIAQQPETSITFKVKDSSEIIGIASGHTVYEVMTNLKEKEKLDFISEYYPGLGYFIQEINGIKNDQGFYWTLYINEKYSMVGASDYILKDKDNVEWKYEKK